MATPTQQRPRRPRNSPLSDFLDTSVSFIGNFWQILVIVGAIVAFYVRLDANVSMLANRVDDLYSENSKYLNRVEKLDSDLRETQNQVNQIIGQLNANYRPSGSFSNSLYRQYNTVDAPIDDNDDSVSGDSVIVVNTLTNQELTANHLAGQKLLLHTNEGNYDSYFYGQVNSDGKWDGYCVFNSYQNGNLSIITEAEYRNGGLVNYRQVFPYTTTTYDEKVWAVSNRKVTQHNVRSGETYYYYRTQPFTCRFDRDAVKVSDILTVDDFLAVLKQQDIGIEGYYNGNSHSGRFNDETGEAYLVKYSAEGFVRLFYKGCFSDGQFYDQTGSAWEVSYSKEDDLYYIYRDTFTNGHPDTVKVPDEITVYEIKQLISDMTITCPLTGWG